MNTNPKLHALWSDEPSTVDLLSFSAIAETVVDAIFDEALDPIALGVSGSWGSGKTTVLNLIEQVIKHRGGNLNKKVLVVRADPWRYDPAIGPKESLISEVLFALAEELSSASPSEAVIDGALKKLIKRVNWSKALKVAARTAITLQLPSLDDITGLISDEPESLETEKGMSAFRAEFQGFLQSPELDHISHVVVLVDDLDRCLPETVVETLEAIRLFLSVKGMSFVIAADETRVAESIQQKLQLPEPHSEEESIASLYLHKIVQTTVPLPALSYFDTRCYLFLLLVFEQIPFESYGTLVKQCNDLRAIAGSLDDLDMPSEQDLSLQAATASRLTPILYEKFKGNPRRIKRFMNDYQIRKSIATRRGIQLEADAVAKLMVLEKLLEKDFGDVLGWLAAGNLKSQFDALGAVADSGSQIVAEDQEGPAKKSTDKDRADFSPTLVRWAKLAPKLDANEVAAYLTLAAAFKGKLLVDEALPEHLRDLAAALTSGSQIERNLATDSELSSLSSTDSATLLSHLGRRMQDDSSIQLNAVNSILRIGDLHPTLVEDVKLALRKLPVEELGAATALLFSKRAAVHKELLHLWAKKAKGSTLRAVESVLKEVK